MAAEKRTNRRWFVSLIIAFSAVIISILLASTYSVLELKILDGLFRLRGPLDVSESPIVLVAVSEQADDEMPKRWPWPREYYARAIENLNQAGVKAIAIDIRLDKADVDSMASDSALARALSKYKNVVLAGNVIKEEKRSYKYGVAISADKEQLDPPYELFTEANPNPWGFVGVNRDNDAVLRRYTLTQTFGDQVFYPLGFEVLRVFQGDTATIAREGDFLRIGDFKVPATGGRNSMYINFHGGPQIFPQFSFDQIVDDAEFMTVSEDEEFQLNSFDDPTFGLLYTDEFRDKIVIIGATMFELQDFYATPFAPSGDHPGFETHANAIQTVLSGNYITEVKPIYLLIGGLIFAIAIAFLTTLLSVGVTLALLVGIILSYITSVIYLFTEYNIYVLTISPMLSLIVTYMGSVVYDYVIQLGEKRRIKDMFSSYVSPTLVEKMITSGEEPKLGGDEVYITAFFSDIASFSTFSELLTPVQLVDLINEYLSEMTDILSDEGATLDKYIGDAIVAFFGAPVHMEDHAYKACVASQYMHMKLAELRMKWKEEGDKWPDIVPEMMMRIGLNTGEMVTGNMGSTRRFNYTMMGDNVNLAARCESGAKAYGVLTMVTEETKLEADKFGDDCLFRHLDKIVVKGRTQPVNMYEIVGLKNYLPQSAKDCAEAYTKGMEYYFKQDWNKAIAQFEHSKALEPWKPGAFKTVKTNPSLVMLDRCSEMKANPPAGDWDGVYVMTSK